MTAFKTVHILSLLSLLNETKLVHVQLMLINLRDTAPLCNN